eukprot:CAMPEP_0172455606 /NCGR_PEP_ID=MMETSP1065-20121228/12152_1 /TAXON_ID=265537 /ORGANISM="Amphiprora paludosa, Strain CCMP125" /LENGTH=478 /DNA_ID=CAMNT_0013208073 /DNA_START=102 /DNA_END=1538 /DNA_ORIENTATION=+
MVDFEDSSQLNQWLFRSTQELEECRAQANLNSREWLVEQDRIKAAAKAASNSADQVSSTPDATASGDVPSSRATSPVPSSGGAAATASSSPATAVSHFACGYTQRKMKEGSPPDSAAVQSKGPWENAKGNPFLTPQEESTLIAFYASKLPTLIGPKASISRLRRESKVTATAALLYRRFFLSNSVMLFDPKAVVVAAAFLASKVEDGMADVRFLIDGTEKMQAPVSQQEIIAAELSLLQGCHYDLLCFHPYKSVLALTEDLRTFLKSEKGQILVERGERPISGQDLKPIYDKAKTILEQVLAHSSDLTLLYSPGPIGMASLIVAQDEIFQQIQTQGATSTTPPPRIDFYGYVQQRFPENNKTASGPSPQSTLLQILPELCQRLQSLIAQKTTMTEAGMMELKQIHKKLKKVRAWGTSSGDGTKKSKKKKKAVKQEDNPPPPVPSAEPGGPPTPTHSNRTGEADDNVEPPLKRVKTEPV